MNRLLSSTAFIVLISTLGSGAIVTIAQSGTLYEEPYRPQYHFSPPQQWMNDPNGMVYYEGEYHLFYQYNPYANKWGPMHWGHAVTRDLVHWDNLPIALFPDRHGTIFSGSAVLDKDNSSGFGSRTNPPLVAVFTYHDVLREHLGRSDFQAQGVAYSLDKGRTWTKYANNPVLANPGARDFRDPKVFWYAARAKWIMALAVTDHVGFYSSPDLKQWTHESDFGKEFGAHTGVWECPDLIEVAVAGSAVRKAVLLVSVNPGGPNGGSATQYFTGNFDGHTFAADRPAGADTALWLDYGTDDYAGSTWSGGKPGDGRSLFIGWMSNWQYANLVPTQWWRSAMTIPRELKLVDSERGLELHSSPVAELAALRDTTSALHPQAVSHIMELAAATGAKTGLLELEVDLDLKDAGVVELIFGEERAQHTSFKINKIEHRYEMDRSASGAVDFSSSFVATQSAPLKGAGERVTLHAFLDRASVEIFINDGETVFTTIVFPSKPYEQISLRADKEIVLNSGKIHAIKSIWKNSDRVDTTP